MQLIKNFCRRSEFPFSAVYFPTSSGLVSDYSRWRHHSWSHIQKHFHCLYKQNLHGLRHINILDITMPNPICFICVELLFREHKQRRSSGRCGGVYVLFYKTCIWVLHSKYLISARASLRPLADCKITNRSKGASFSELAINYCFVVWMPTRFRHILY